MLGRRQIRAKVLQALYAHKMQISSINREINHYDEEENLSPEDIQNAEKYIAEKTLKNFTKGIDEIYDLYIFTLNILTHIRKKAIDQNKSNLKRKVSVNPHEIAIKSISENLFLEKLSRNTELVMYTNDNPSLQWDLIEDYITLFLKDIVKSDLMKYHLGQATSFKSDRSFILEIFKKIIAPNEKLRAHFESENLHWDDSFPIANSMVENTLRKIKKETDSSYKLMSVYKNTDDKAYASSLFLKSVEHNNEISELINTYNDNWDLEQMNQLDLLITQMGICEFLHFKTIPVVVTINEYIEIAKDYSTPQSSKFINGILNKVQKELVAEKKIEKQVRG